MLRSRAGARGFTYLGLIILLAIMALVAAAGLKMGSLLQRAAAEEELLEIGAQFTDALRSYAAATPPGKPTHPPTLQDLLKDPRFPNPRRHLRKIFVDPVTGKAEWGVIWLGDKIGVLGVYSLSNARPLKIANFDIRFENMDNREKISDWKFMPAGLEEGAVGAAQIPANSMTGTAPPPSLFPSPLSTPGTGGALGTNPGANPGANPNGNSGGKSGTSGIGAATGDAGKSGGSAAAPAPPPPVPEQQPGADEPPAEEAAPTEPPVEEEKEEDKAEDSKSLDPVEPSTIVTPPPPRRR